MTYRQFCIILLFYLSISSYAQNLEEVAKEIEAEGNHLYRLELAAWMGSDIFRENYKGEMAIGGYFSYIDSNTPKCLFFSKDENPKVIGVVSFGDIKIIETASIDFKLRDFKKEEKELYTIRQKALEEIKQDSIFKNYTNTNLNLIPLINKNQRKVFVLTGTKIEGVVLFGNDYLLAYDKSNTLQTKEEIHKDLIPIDFNNQSDSISLHTHHSQTDSPFITSTDICTLMLYAKFAKWKKHYVASEKYVSIWNCEKEALQIVTKEEFDNMSEEEL